MIIVGERDNTTVVMMMINKKSEIGTRSKEKSLSALGFGPWNVLKINLTNIHGRRGSHNTFELIRLK
jgi:hypothetical protein